MLLIYSYGVVACRTNFYVTIEIVGNYVVKWEPGTVTHDLRVCLHYMIWCPTSNKWISINVHDIMDFTHNAVMNVDRLKKTYKINVCLTFNYVKYKLITQILLPYIMLNWTTIQCWIAHVFSQKFHEFVFIWFIFMW